MDEELNPCVKILLCGLNAAAQSALRQAIRVLILQVEAQLVPLQAYLVYLDLATAPLNLVNTSIKQIANEIRSIANLIPLNLVAQCVDLNKYTESWSAAFESDLAFINRSINELNRYLSFRDEIEALIADLKASLALLNQINILIGDCDDNNA